ncbi:O-acetyl-ADP-ribose deacetylase [Candidatus Poribacteria bacterium]|nr:O-acetyl-ADP-ribose deacetylase [Candidatus Poribacteria bacterium]
MFGRIVVRTGDLTAEDTDAIVNAANSSLMGGGGVDGAIHRAGGPQILEECRRIRATTHPDGLPVGEAVSTSGGRLKARYVIHTVGPVWHGGNQGEPELLASCYRNALVEGERLGVQSVAFPAISTGVFGYPADKAAQVAAEAVQDYLAAHTSPEMVRFVFFGQEAYVVFLANAGLG